MQSKKRIGVILMTYGSPKSLEEIPRYLRNIYGGKEAKPDTIIEFQRRYSLIGGSPLVHITQEQAAALQQELSLQFKENIVFQVSAGMRFSEPFISHVLSEIALDSNQLIGIIMSPQYSPIIMQGYQLALKKAVTELPEKKQPLLTIAENWYDEPLFLQALAQKVQQALSQFPKKIQKKVPIVFSAHSMPKRVVQNEPEYIISLQETASKVAKILKLPAEQWKFCYQSAGHTPEEWLKPDFADIMPQLKQEGFRYVVIAPVQFLADHLEILYDVEIAARKQAEDHGLSFIRTQSLNTSPLFIKALAEVVKKQII